jgi:predicted nucleotide-binding protein
MYYHVIAETREKQKDKFITYHDFDIIDKEIVKVQYLKPFVQGTDFQVDGYFVNKSNLRRFLIKSSVEKTDVLVKKAYNSLSPGMIVFFTAQSVIEGDKSAKDITKELMQEIQGSDSNIIPSTSQNDKKINRRVFIVHGRDELLKTQTARFLEKLNFDSIILHEQASEGKTIIEKIESYTDVGFSIVLYTPCDEGRLVGTKDFKKRARQNVVFEHGYLIAKLGRSRVVALVKDTVETPNDILGVVYISVGNSNAWQFSIAKELKAAGFEIDLNAII